MVVGVGWWMVVGWVVGNWVGGGVTGVWVVFECLLDRHQGRAKLSKHVFVRIKSIY